MTHQESGGRGAEGKCGHTNTQVELVCWSWYFPAAAPSLQPAPLNQVTNTHTYTLTHAFLSSSSIILCPAERWIINRLAGYKLISFHRTFNLRCLNSPGGPRMTGEPLPGATTVRRGIGGKTDTSERRPLKALRAPLSRD